MLTQALWLARSGSLVWTFFLNKPRTHLYRVLLGKSTLILFSKRIIQKPARSRAIGGGIVNAESTNTPSLIPDSFP